MIRHVKLPVLWALFILISLFFLLRLTNILSLPVFGDEAIYIRWSQLIKNVDTLRFVPLSDGKQPLFMWFSAVALKLFDDPLLAGRLISVGAGLVIILSIYFICLILFSPKIALISAFIYLFLPFSFFFDRMALPDNLLSAFGALALLFSILLAKYPRFDLAMVLGGFLGLAWLTKSPAIYFVVLSFITFFVYQKHNFQKFYLPLTSSVIAFLIYNILRLGPQFHMIALRNRDYLWTLTDLLSHPFDPLIPHFKDILIIYAAYVSWPLLILSAVGLWLYFRTSRPKASFYILLAWWLLPLLANSALAKVFTARYILFTLPPLVALLAVGLSSLSTLLRNNYFINIIIFIIMLPNIFIIKKLITDPFNFQPPPTESGYFSDWTSGWGIQESSKYLISRSKEANVIVGTEGYFGTLPDGLQIYTDSLPQLTVFGIGIDINQIPEKLIDARNYGDEVYLLANQSRLKLSPELLSRLSLVHSYQKPGDDNLLLFRLN